MPDIQFRVAWKRPAPKIQRDAQAFWTRLNILPEDTTAAERQTEICMEQMKRCLEAAGASLDNVMKCNIFCTSSKHFQAVNAIYARYFPKDPPARIYVCIPEWTGPFDIEIDCIAMV